MTTLALSPRSNEGGATTAKSKLPAPKETAVPNTIPPPMEKSEKLDILIADDEANICRVLTICLEAKGHRVECVSSAPQVMVAAEKKTYDILLLDVRLGSDSGLDLIVPFLHRFPWTQIIVITAHASVDSAVKAMQDGARDYLAKPFSPDQVLHTIAKVRKLANLESKVEELTARTDFTPRESTQDLMVSSSEPMRSVLKIATSVASTDATILIRGESGTGKTLLARAIHEASHRANHPFVVVSCPSLSNELLESELFGHVKGSFTGAHRDYAGRIASAQRGTLFLDEIGEMSATLQAKMLRFVQDREYESVGDTITKKADVRLITATNVDLERAVQEGRFREDLLFRLNVIELEMPPLRERRSDIVPIAEKLLAELAPKFNRPARQFTDGARQLLQEYSWPGNIRELRNVVERCILLSPSAQIGADLMPIRIAQSPGRMEGREVQPVGDDSRQEAKLMTLDDLERAHIERALVECSSLEEAARTLGIDQTTLYRRRKRYGMI